MKEKGRGKSVDWLSVGIASLALAVSVWSARETREHDKISTMPSLTFTWYTDANSDDDQGIELSNVGLGPAKVTGFQIMLDDKPMSLVDVVASFTEENKPASNEVRFRHVEPSSSAPIGAGKDIPLIRIATKNPDLRSKVEKFLWRLKVRVTSCSFYGECSDIFFPSHDAWRS
jgi:hypothetical protein